MHALVKLLVAWLDTLDPSLGGIALGIVACRNTATLSMDLLGSFFVSKVISVSFSASSATFAILFVLRLVASPSKLLAELSAPVGICSYSTFLMTVTQLFAQLYSISSTPSVIGVYVSSCLQIVLGVWFLWRCWQSKMLPEPIWFPPTVGIAVVVIAGDTVGIMYGVSVALFWLAFAWTAVLVPWVSLRILKYTFEVAFDATVFILPAPCSLLTVAWLNLDKAVWIQSNEFKLVFATILYVMSVLVLSLTIFCVIQRRDFICEGFKSTWASSTFALAITATSILEYASYVRGNMLLIISQVVSWALLVYVFVIIMFYTCMMFKPQPTTKRMAERKDRKNVRGDKLLHCIVNNS